MGRDYNMCRAMEEMLADAKADGMEQGSYRELYALVQEGLFTLRQAAQRKHLSEEAFQEKLTEFGIM